MPSASTAERLAVDETSFAFDGDTATVEAALDLFNDALEELLADGHAVRFHPDAYELVECRDGHSLIEFLVLREDTVSPTPDDGC